MWYGFLQANLYILTHFLNASVGIPDNVVNRAREVLELKTAGKTIRKRKEPAPSGPHVEEQLGAFFASVQDWTKASDDELAKLLTMARMADQ